ncbi:energy transducer TonB [Mucilaginibacter calamicampi]|uniref:Energy transducer TonB n=1 Tax=Mucilaginibacter calamicampi TaxID=1302352 RepID=A0ABW2YW09_9SPHI
MLISNFNLYKSEWLDLVFDKRNKEYGAYNIRQHYAENLTRALLISVAVVVGGAVALGAAIKVEPVISDGPVVVVDLKDIKQPSTPPKKEEPVKPELEKPKAAEPVKTRQYVEMVVTANPTEVEPATIAELQNVAVGPQNVEGPANGPTSVLVEPGAGSGPGEDITESNVPVSTGVLSVLPAPVGGDEAWTKFLRKNLRYPEQAMDAEKGGKVWISFVIEKDGTLTDIKVLKAAGYGMDEEALRVLKKAPAWTPGIQRGKPVRVAFTLPINFSLGN